MKIENMSVRDVGGELFNLNDLHNAAGGRKDQSPALFMRSKKVSDLVGELSKVYTSVPFKKVMGRNGGTYACKEIVYAYAMWISPEFHGEVIRCFDAVISKNLAVLGQLSHLITEVGKASKTLIAICNESSIALHVIKNRGPDCGVYGAAI